VGGPIAFKGGNTLAWVDELNRRSFTKAELSEENYYTKSGRLSPRLKEEIQQALKTKFGKSSGLLEHMDWSGQGFLVYAMLKKEFQFVNQFADEGKDFFIGSKKKVSYFGTNEDPSIEVQFYHNKHDFAVTLNTKQGDRVHLYRTDERGTLAELYAKFQQKAKAYTGNRDFTDMDSFKAPKLDFKSMREFTELYRRRIEAPKQRTDIEIKQALETLEFEMDEVGAKVKSEAVIMGGYTGIPDFEQEFEKPRYFYVTGPYAMFIEESGKQPYLAMYITDAEKLQTKQFAVQKDASDSDSTTVMSEEGKANLDKLLKIVNRINQINEEASRAEPIDNPEDVLAFAKLCKDCPPDVVKRVLEAKTINDPIYEDGGTALHAASYLGLVEQIQPLLAAGADVNKQDNDGETPLLMASYNGHTEVAQMLIDAGADVNYFGYWNALMNASNQGHLDTVNVLLKAGADVNAQDPDKNGTALMVASQHGYNDIVNTLLAAGAKVDARDSGGGTALMTACYAGQLETAKILLSAGADINATDNYGKSVMQFAQKGGHADVINFLRTRGAETGKELAGQSAAVANTTSQIDKKQLQSQLVHQCRWGSIEKVKELLALGADVNQSVTGTTPLKNAVLGDNPQIVELLIKQGAAVTPDIVQLAQNHQNKEIISLLESAGAKE
jgi:ankyrin repeat protein